MEDYIFQVQIIEDGNCTWTRSFNSALEAVNTYNSIKDYGFAREIREAMLIEPNGKVHEKAFYRPGSRPLQVK
jgi:peroxiredoxin